MLQHNANYDTFINCESAEICTAKESRTSVRIVITETEIFVILSQSSVKIL
jgi:hypothetical protein